MRRPIPRSFLWFLATGVLMLLQMLPWTGIFLMLMLAMLWSVAFINLGMIGTAWEALTGRVSRFWLIVPLTFYGGYYAFAISDHLALARLRTENDAANAPVHIPFDPTRQVLASLSVDQHAADGLGLIQDYGLPVFYERNRNYPQGFRATRMIDGAICTKVRDTQSLSAAGIWVSWFDDNGGKRFGGKLVTTFCMLSQPERPTLPVVGLTIEQTTSRLASLPVTGTVTRITMPGGQVFTLRGGSAAPLRWLPMPFMGCGLNSGAPSWDCAAGFMRAGFAPTVSTGSRQILAAALGLSRVPAADRKADDPQAVLALIARAEADALAKDIAAFDRIVADPTANIDSVPFRVLAIRPDALNPRAGSVIAGLERAAAADPGPTRDNGRNLARLLTRLPPQTFQDFGQRIVALYTRADGKHWLWEADDLIDRLGDLGAPAMPLLIRPANGTMPARIRSVEAACRLGAVGRPLAPLLQAQWAATRDYNRDERRELYVAMRRIGIAVPPLNEDKRNIAAKLATDWADITPQSPARVCAVNAEEQARREEKYQGKRRSNLF